MARWTSFTIHMRSWHQKAGQTQRCCEYRRVLFGTLKHSCSGHSSARLVVRIECRTTASRITAFMGSWQLAGGCKMSAYGPEEKLQKCGRQPKALSTEPNSTDGPGFLAFSVPICHCPIRNSPGCSSGNQARNNFTMKRRVKPVLSVSCDSNNKRT